MIRMLTIHPLTMPTIHPLRTHSSRSIRSGLILHDPSAQDSFFTIHLLRCSICPRSIPSGLILHDPSAQDSFCKRSICPRSIPSGLILHDPSTQTLNMPTIHPLRTFSRCMSIFNTAALGISHILRTSTFCVFGGHCLLWMETALVENAPGLPLLGVEI